MHQRGGLGRAKALHSLAARGSRMFWLWWVLSRSARTFVVQGRFF